MKLLRDSGERYPTLPHRSWLRHQTPPRVGVKRRGDARGRSRDTSRQVSLTQKPKRPDKSKGKGAWDCFVLEFNLNLFKAGRDLGLASKLSKCTLLMRSAANSPASLINILHGGEDVGKSTDEKTGKFQENPMSAGSNSQPANTQKNSPNGANTTTPTHRNNMVSVEPMHMTPGAVDRSGDIVLMSTHQLCNYLEQAN